MKNYFIKFILFLLIICISPIQQAFANFPDVPITHTNYQAITYLQENNIINGYPNGTFMPNQSVNRAEFLKIILEGSNIKLDITNNTPFKDINNSAWYAPYIKKAYAEGWIIGYNDGSFRPEQTINKVEALKILAEVQNWQTYKPTNRPFTDVDLNQWFTNYVEYAKTNNFLEETGSLFHPSQLMTRANISEIIYRTLTETLIETENNTPPIINLEQIEIIESNIDQNSEQSIPLEFYENITLNQEIPGLFYQNEIYKITGKTNSSDYDSVTIIIKNTNTSEIKAYSAKLTNNQFEIPIYFKESGEFLLGIINGSEGVSKASPISVVQNLPRETKKIINSFENNINLIYQNDRTFIELSPIQNTINKVTFSQNEENVTYLSRQYLNKIPVQYEDFENFQKGSIHVSLETASTSSSIPLEINNRTRYKSNKTQILRNRYRKYNNHNTRHIQHTRSNFNNRNKQN